MNGPFDPGAAVSVEEPPGPRWMFVSYGERPAGNRQLQGSGDALSTGAVKSETGLATSADGLRWKWERARVRWRDKGQG